MVRVIHALYDGTTLHPEAPLRFPPNTRLTVVVSDSPSGAGDESFVDAVGSLNPMGPSGWSENPRSGEHSRTEGAHRASPAQATHLLEKIAALPPEMLAEVEDFVDILLRKDDEHLLRLATMKLSEPAFAEIWDNDVDAAYDRV